MLRSFFVLILGATLLVAACSDGEGNEAPADAALDALAPIEPDAAIDAGAVDVNAPDVQQADVSVDAAPQSNSGAICGYQAGGCPKGSGDTCFFLGKVTSGGGMCLGECDTEGQRCPVADPSTMYSVCRKVETTIKSTLMCIWYCAINGEMYDCPNATDYVCDPWDDNQPEIGICKPKKAI